MSRPELVLAISMLLPVAAAVLLLALQMPVRDALDGALSVWSHGFQARNLGQPFYLRVLGADDLSGNGHHGTLSGAKRVKARL